MLGDIEIAQGIERDKEKKQKEVKLTSLLPRYYYDKVILFIFIYRLVVKCHTPWI